MRKGVYGLAVEARGEVAVCRLGRHCFEGTYLYIGSARGPGGIRRLYRHFQIAQGCRAVRRWHIDYLLAIGRAEGAFFIETDQPLECLLVAHLTQVAPTALPGFGSSDCRCPSHLLWLREGLAPILEAVAGLGLSYQLLTFNPSPWTGAGQGEGEFSLPPGEEEQKASQGR